MTNLVTTTDQGDLHLADDSTLVPTDETKVVRFGMLLLAIALGTLVVWGGLAPLARGVVAPGTIVVDSNRKTIQHLEGGIVSEILVRDGDVVSEGQVLMRLDGTNSQAQRDLLNGQYLVALGQEARLLAERDGKNKISFPSDLLVADRAGRNASIRDTEQEVFDARRQSLSGQLSIYEQRIGQLDQQINGLKAQGAANDEQVRLIDGELEGLRELFQKGFASKTRLLELERRRADLIGSRGSLDADIARASVAIGEARLQILQLRKNFEEEVTRLLQETQQRIFDLQDRLTSANDIVERREVRSPSEGIVVGSRVHTVGGVVRGSDPLMEIVPKNDKLIIEIMVAPQDIDVVVQGLVSEVRFSALSTRRIPILFGHVTKVSADAAADQNGNRFYVARVEVSPDELSKLGAMKLIPGMPAEVLVKAGERTFLKYLTEPLTDSFFRAFKEG